MSRDAKGIHQYTELDSETTFSEYMNLGQESVSEAIKYFSGTSVQRAALNPAPPGALWRDTDGAKRLYSVAPDGTWRIQEARHVASTAPWGSTDPTANTRVRTVTIDLPTILAAHEHIEVVLSASSGFNTLSMATINRGATKTTIRVNFVQFITPYETGFEMIWRIVAA